ncbi:MAG: dipicolinate synthase subunit DpsA [Clostridia bacterium]|nr:dipicolinate synthase subunit DpsA [Clostridia bacterium]
MLKKSISVVGGDLRIVNLVQMLVNDGYTVFSYGLELSDELSSLEGVEMCPTVEEVIGASDVVIGPIPVSSDRKNLSMPFSNVKLPVEDFINKFTAKNLVSGTIADEYKKELLEKNVNYIDLQKREEFTVLNTIATAEGTIQIVMEETQRTIHGSNVLIMGFGRIGKVLAKMLDGIGAKVFCEARKNEDIAWIKAYGYEPIHLTNLNENLGKFDVIINTIPFQVLDDERLKLVKKDIVLIDVASNPGGIDRNVAKKMNLKLIWALSLPGKVAPLTSAEFIKETIYHILKEI